jgi:hypothetical protein
MLEGGRYVWLATLLHVVECEFVVCRYAFSIDPLVYSEEEWSGEVVDRFVGPKERLVYIPHYRVNHVSYRNPRVFGPLPHCLPSTCF